jgi:hypothetical protein
MRKACNLDPRLKIAGQTAKKARSEKGELLAALVEGEQENAARNGILYHFGNPATLANRL